MKEIIKVPGHLQWHDYTKNIVLKNGLRMAYMEAGNPEGEVIIMIHGFSDSSRIWRSTILEGLDEKYHIYAVDLRGFGQSDKPEQFIYTMTQHAEDIIDFMNVMEIPQVYLIGHSMGSVIAQTVAFSAADRIKKVILASTMMHMHESPKEVRDVRQLYENMDLTGSSDEDLQKEFLPFAHKNKDKTFAEGYLTTLRGLTGNSLRAAWLGMSVTDNRNLVQFITAKIMILWGTQDGIFTQEYQEEVKECLPKAQFIELPGVGHEIPNEVPEKIAQAALRFFQ